MGKKVLKEVTAIGGDVSNSPSTGFFIGPIGAKPIKRKLYKSPEDSYLYNESGERLTKTQLNEMLFETTYKTNPIKAEIEPKCEAFPYCDKSVLSEGYLRLIENSDEGMCQDCRQYCESVGGLINKSADYIAEIINKKYSKL